MYGISRQSHLFWIQTSESLLSCLHPRHDMVTPLLHITQTWPLETGRSSRHGKKTNGLYIYLSFFGAQMERRVGGRGYQEGTREESQRVLSSS